MIKNSCSSETMKIQLNRLDQLIGYHLRRAQNFVFEDFVKSIGDDAITPGQFGVLSVIFENQGLNQSTLAKTIGIERSTMVGVIDTLEKRGIVVRKRSEIDKRSYGLQLSPTGKDLLNRVEKKVSDHEQRLSANLTAKERSQLIKLLKKIG